MLIMNGVQLAFVLLPTLRDLTRQMTSSRSFIPLIRLPRLKAPPLKSQSFNRCQLRRPTLPGQCRRTIVEPLPPRDNEHLNTSDVRRSILKDSLDKLQINSDAINTAMDEYILNPSSGYDGRFGKSAIRTYRSFVFPKRSSNTDPVLLAAEAGRCARQIEFLLKRHHSHQAALVRHHDNENQSSKVQNRFPLVLILDNIRSAFNVGSLFRTADATGCSWVLTTGITPHPGGGGAEKVSKSALGAEHVVPTQHFTTTREALELVRAMGDFCLVGVETTNDAMTYTDYNYGPYSQHGVCLVLGNEVTGVDTSLMENFDVIVEIPMYGTKNSLNVAACAPVVLYEVLRQWRV